MKRIRINIQSNSERDKIVSGLANSGYYVKIEKEKQGLETIYWVIFEVPDINVE